MSNAKKKFDEVVILTSKISKHLSTNDKLIPKEHSVIIGGRYNKFSRQLSQTPWLVNGESKLGNSVQEQICTALMNYTQAKSHKFLSSGREDVDVRMLSSGRPFAVELINSKITKISQEELHYLRETINKDSNKIQIKVDLKILTRDKLKYIKQGEVSKSKSYRAFCICKKTSETKFRIDKLDTLRNLKIIQNTPVRVLHRRTLFPRQRFIFEIRGRLANTKELSNFLRTTEQTLNNFFFVIFDVKTQAGTYVKEFVHGDFGRTFPNLCHLLKTEIDLMALDVTNISVKWP